MKETDKIKDRYARRVVESSSANSLYSDFISNERNKIYNKVLKEFGPKPEKLKFLEIGAGSGGNISFFKTAGLKSENIFANELLEDRILALKNNHPDIHIFPGDAMNIPEAEKFDIVFQSTVFTSILDSDFRIKLADKMWDLLKPGGFILWYDFTYDNPKNPDVKKVSVKELKRLFPNGKFVLGKKVTLAPPIGRRVGKGYSFFNAFPFLRTHYIAVIQKTNK